ncbi:MAG: 50S ribosomal protein L35 [Candidatus Cloacimonetes bacterium]|nr:50S ribosomal protein L35 [Candidatus Cloacimonadota bacterium]
MPKMKTKSAAKKRFVALKSGKFKRAKANRRHNLTQKGTTRKRNLGLADYVNASQEYKVRRMLPYGA